jgi:hypothetical protein
MRTQPFLEKSFQTAKTRTDESAKSVKIGYSPRGLEDIGTKLKKTLLFLTSVLFVSLADVATGGDGATCPP